VDRNSFADPQAARDGDWTHKTGLLPEDAPLAAAYVPFQRRNAPQYSSEDGLTRGTIFPGLDLPFKNIPNTTNPEQGAALGQLMAMDFALDELELYLDTHADDQEAFEVYQYYLPLAQTARESYVEKYGPVSQMDMKGMKEYTWLKGPWPWEYPERTG